MFLERSPSFLGTPGGDSTGLSFAIGWVAVRQKDRVPLCLLRHLANT